MLDNTKAKANGTRHVGVQFQENRSGHSARMEKTVKVRKKVTDVFLAGLGTNN